MNFIVRTVLYFPVRHNNMCKYIFSQHKRMKSSFTKKPVSNFFIEDVLDIKYNHFYEMLDAEAAVFLENMDESMKAEKLDLEVMIDVMRHENPEVKIPTTITPHNWKVILTLMDTKQKQYKYLSKLWENEQEKIVKNTMAKSLVEDVYNSEFFICDDDNNPIRRTYSMHRYHNRWKGVQSMMFGRPVILDMDYDVDVFEGNQTVTQIVHMYRNNCQHISPCHLHFTSVNRSRHLLKFLQTAAGSHIAADFHDEHFLDLFPRENLFYLTPEGPVISWEDVPRDSIFILGGIGSAGITKRSYIKARELGIPQGSLPLRKYVSFNERTRQDLYLNVVLGVLLDKFNGRSWKYAFDNNLPDVMFDKHPNAERLVDQRTLKRQRWRQKQHHHHMTNGIHERHRNHRNINETMEIDAILKNLKK